MVLPLILLGNHWLRLSETRALSRIFGIKEKQKGRVGLCG
jgi:hypothetical protein